MADYTVGRLARKFGLSRSTLLYYDSIGLLRPQGRADGEYRHYGEKEVERLERICLFRKTGMSLKDVAKVLDADTELAKQLESRLVRLNTEIDKLREQQRLILKLMNNPEMEKKVRMSRARWTELLRSSGYSEQDMRQWHINFERHDPDEHQRFLEFLCIPEQEIKKIRAWIGGQE